MEERQKEDAVESTENEKEDLEDQSQMDEEQEEDSGSIAPKVEEQKIEDLEYESLEDDVLDEAPSPEGEDKKDSKKKYVVIAIVLILFILLIAGVCIYYRGMTYYKAHFFPNVDINGIDCGGQEADTVIEILDSAVEGYTLEVLGRDYRTGESNAVLGSITSDDVGLYYMGTREDVEDLLQKQNEFRWIEACFSGNESFSLERAVAFDEMLLKSAVESWDACKQQNMRTAKDAYIGEYSEELGCYEIVPETAGTELDVNSVIPYISEAITEQRTCIDLEELGCYKEAFVRSDDRRLTDVVENVNKWLGTKVVYDWNGTEVILDREILKDWISIEDGDPKLDEDAVTAFVKEQASAYDTYGKQRSFMTTHGFEVTLSNRSYGWKTDTEGEAEELRQLIYQGSTIEKEPLYSITAMNKGTDDLGDSYVEADLSNQHLYLYQDGEIVLETDFVSGTMVSSRGDVTPEGIFGITYKTKNAVLKGATYRTPVKYWMPFYGNYGMHDASWRKAFGGEIFKTNGSHGCINLPPSMAGKIYEYVSKGFPVICYYSEGIPYVGPPVAPPVAPPPEDGAAQEQENPEEAPVE